MSTASHHRQPVLPRLKDTQLSPDYPVVRTVDEPGLQVLDRIATAGHNGDFEPSLGGGAPDMPDVVASMTVAG